MKNIYHIDKKITKNDEITDRTWISIEEPTAEEDRKSTRLNSSHT